MEESYSEGYKTSLKMANNFLTLPIFYKIFVLEKITLSQFTSFQVTFAFTHAKHNLCAEQSKKESFYFDTQNLENWTNSYFYPGFKRKFTFLYVSKDIIPWYPAEAVYMFSGKLGRQYELFIVMDTQIQQSNKNITNYIKFIL